MSNNLLKKGDSTLYQLSSEPDSPLVLANVIGVHHDDFPNVYYTISFVDPTTGLSKEKQTDSSRVSSSIPSEDLPPSVEQSLSLPGISENTISLSEYCDFINGQEGESTESVSSANWNFKVIYGSKIIDIVNAPLNCPISILKEALSHVTNILATNQKLIVKGSNLKDHSTISGGKISPCCKITLIGSHK